MIRQKTSQRIFGHHWRSRLNIFDVLSLLAIDSSACGVQLKASNIQHDNVVCEKFSGRPFGAEVIVSYYYDISVYANLTTQKQVWKMYGEGIMSVTIEDFSASQFIVSKTFWECTGKVRSAWIVPSRFGCERFINDILYLPGDNSIEI